MTIRKQNGRQSGAFFFKKESSRWITGFPTELGASTTLKTHFT